MRYLSVVFFLLLLQACKHPLAIVGEGDIVDLNETGFGCTLEEFNSNAPRCENDVTSDYFVNFSGVPRPGWQFSHWEGACAKTSEAPNCRFDAPASWSAVWDADAVFSTIQLAPLTAVFVEVEPLDAQFNFTGTLDADRGSPSGTNYTFTDMATITNSGNTYKDYLNPSPDYGTEGDTSFVRLDWDDYLGFDPGLLSSLNLDQPARIDLRFQFHVEEPVVNTSPCCPTALSRHILSSNSGDQRDLGFSLQVVKEGENTYFMVLLIGDGRSFLGDNPLMWSEGYRFRLGRINPDEWVSVNLTFRLAEPGQERITGFINGASFTGYLNKATKLNANAFKRHLEGATVGRPPDQTYAELCATYGCYEWGLSVGQEIGVAQPSMFIGSYPSMDPHNAEIDLSIDKFIVQSPITEAEPEVLRTILDDFTQHVTNQQTQSEVVLLQWLEAFTGGFVGDWEAIKSSALAYLDAFAASNEPLFPDNGTLSPSNFSPEQRLTYFLEQWILDNRFQGQFDPADSGIQFEDSEKFPGIVKASAPRSGGTVEVDATYNTDPGILLNNQETVIRPTGFYAAPGEAITIALPEAASASGLKVRIGLHRADMEDGGWVEFNRFPRISSLYDVNSASLTVANPFGGGIYFEVPDGSDLGVISVTINNAVKLPMFSTLDLAGHSDDLTQFTVEADAWNVPWFEMHGRHFSATLPMNEVRLYPDPAALLKITEDGFDAIHLMAGRPLDGFRSEWLSYDRWVTVFGTAMAASYPIYANQEPGPDGAYWERPPNFASPAFFLDPEFFAPDDPEDQQDQWDERLYNSTLFHEWGHLHNLPTLNYQEQESNVHLLASVFYNLVMGADIDTALKWSGFQFFDRDQAALDTMFSPNWQEGNRLAFGEMIYGIWDNEVRYQTRSWARLVEIAALYGWDAVGNIHKAFYDRGVAQGAPVNYGLQDDDFIETASAALNMDLSPLFDFWGVPPSDEARQRLDQFTAPAEFEARLLHYRDLAPTTPEEFQQVYDSLAPTNSGEVIVRLDYYKQVFDEQMGAIILGRIDGILCQYYTCPS